MQAIWSFLSDPKNQRTLGFLGTGLVVVIGAAWAVFTYFNPPGQVGAEDIDLTVDKYVEIESKIEEKVKARYEGSLAAAKENTALAKEAQELYEKEVGLLKTLLQDRERSIDSLKTTLSEASAVLSANPEGFSRSEIDAANKQIKSGDAEEATKLLLKAAARAKSEAAEAEFLLGKLAESEADLEKMARHFRRAVQLDPGNGSYRDYENQLYDITVVYDYEMRDQARTIADALQAAGFHTRTMNWNDYKEDDDGAMSSWVRRWTFLYGPPTVQSKVAEVEGIVAEAGFKLEVDHRHKLQRGGSHWGFSGLDIFFWLPNKDL